jgi:hypothetical protein
VPVADVGSRDLLGLVQGVAEIAGDAQPVARALIVVERQAGHPDARSATARRRWHALGGVSAGYQIAGGAAGA